MSTSFGSVVKRGMWAVLVVVGSCAVVGAASAASPTPYGYRTSSTSVLSASLSTVNAAERAPSHVAHDLTGRAIVQLRSTRGDLHSQDACRLVDQSLNELSDFQRGGRSGHLTVAERLITRALAEEQSAYAAGYRHVSGYGAAGYSVPVATVPPPVIVHREPASGIRIGGHWGQISLRF